jgi:hypothetical protein
LAVIFIIISISLCLVVQYVKDDVKQSNQKMLNMMEMGSEEALQIQFYCQQEKQELREHPLYTLILSPSDSSSYSSPWY